MKKDKKYKKESPQSIGGKRTAIIRRKQAIDEYYKNPNYCKCGRIIEVKANEKVREVKRKQFCDYECFKKYYALDTRNKIIELFNHGKKFREISNELKCSISTVSYYCSELIPKDERYSNENIKKYQRYYDTYKNINKTSKFFDIPVATLRSKLVLYKKVKIIDENNENERLILTKNPEERNEQLKKSVTLWRRRKKIMAVEYKGGKCQICGYNKSYNCLDFHHIDPSKKDFNISGKNISWGKIKNELDKCVLVCRNCHGEIHEEIFLKGYSKILKKLMGNW